MASHRPPWSSADDDEPNAGPSALPPPPPAEKKPRKKWSQEETQMLVDGCNRHGVGNWKTILGDPTLKFDSRSPVDLKDRFRTYFPDAYKKHYPNARTHLSSKVRSTLPDGSSLFEKTRSKRRRPFTEEEDRALKAGYEKHGTVWATIVKDPVFQEQNRRSTDLRDRFRNAFPDLYQAAGYKPRNNTGKKKKEHDLGRAATDDQLALSTSGITGPVRGIRRRRAQTSQGILLRGGTKSVPQSAACSEYEDSSGPEDEDGDISSSVTTNMLKTPLSSVPVVTDSMKKCDLGLHPSPSSTLEHSFIDDDDMGMRLIPLDSISSDPLAEYPSSALENHPQPPNPISPLQHTPTHPHHPWSSSQDNEGNSANDSHQTSQQHHDGPKIGQSAWGPQDWLSANPRLDHSFPSTSNGNSTPGTGTPSSYFSPSSPFTSYNLPSLNNTNSHPLSPTSNTTTINNATTSSPTTTASTTTTSGSAAPPSSSSSAAASTPQTTNPLIGNITNLTTLNLPMNYINYHNSHQHHGVIERYDLWPPSSSALALTSTFSAVNNSSGWSGSGGGYSGPFGSESFAGDMSSNSEVSFNEDEVQSTFSDDFSNTDEGVYNSLGYINNNPTGSGRAITHHSDYAGDLIFGARGYGIGGGFGWFGGAYAPLNTTGPHSANGNPGTLGLGLMGITTKGNEKTGEGDGHHENMENNDEVVVVGDGKGSINPMQLHAPSPHTQTTTAIDEIALAGINLNDSQDEDEEMQAIGVDAPRGENGGVGIEVVEAVEEDDAMDGISTGPTTRRRRRTIGGISGRGFSSTPASSSPSSPAKRTTQRSASGSGVKSATASPQLQFRNANLGTLRLPSGQTFNHHAIQQPHLHNIALSLASNAHSSPSSSTSSSTSASLATPPGGNRALSLSPSVAPQTTSSSTTTAVAVGMMTPYGGRFSLDDLDLIEFAQAQHALVDINNLTPPATPVMHHALRGSRKFSMFGGGGGVGGVGGSGGAGNGLGLLLQGQSAGRSISVPPGEARNAMVSGNSGGNGNGGGGNNSLGMSVGGGDTGSPEGPSGGVAQRGRSLTANGNTAPSATSGVKRSLSSTVHHSHGQAQQHHGHSLSMSTFPPFPSHSEIWRAKTPVAKPSSTGNLGATDAGNSAAASSNAAGGTATVRTTNANVNASTTGSGSASAFFSGLFSPPSSSSSSSSGVPFTQQQQVNTDVYTNPDLPFLDLHYNLGHAQSQVLLQQQHQQQQQSQQGFGAMLIDTPSTTGGALMAGSGFGGGGDNSGGGGGMTQAELEARQALDLAQPYYMHGHGHHPHHHHQQQQQHAFGQGQGHQHSLSQGSGFGFPSTATTTTNNRNASTLNGSVGSTSVGGGGGGLKSFMGNVFNTPLSLTRQCSQFSVSATTARQQQQQRPQPHHPQQQQQPQQRHTHTHQHQHHHHQRGQSQQVVVNPRDLVLNAVNAGSESDGNGNGMLSSSLMLDGSKRKRASWDGGMV